MSRTIEEIKADIANYARMREDGTASQIDVALEVMRFAELYHTICDGIPLSGLQTMCTAWKDGRCIILPCKVGDTVWAEGWVKNVCDECTVMRVSYDVETKTVRVLYYPHTPDTSFIKVANGCRGGIFSKAVFLTRESAEAAMEGEKGC